LQEHFYFFQLHNANAKKNKKELASQRTKTDQNGQTCMDRRATTEKEQRTANST
jgi:hypothetical protein